MRQAMGTGDGGGGDNATGCVSSRRPHLRGVLWMAGQATGSSDGGGGNNAMGGDRKEASERCIFGILYQAPRENNNDACEALLHVNFFRQWNKRIDER